jgi:preprotein translocase subunit SecE
MDDQIKKWVGLSFLAAAALVGYIFFSYGNQAFIYFELESKLRGAGVSTPSALLLPWASALIAMLTGFLLYRNQKINLFMTEVVVELGKVTWPTQKETTSATFVVIIMVLISGVVLGFLDFVWTQLLMKIF